MYFVVLGVLLVVLKVAEFGPVGLWAWWQVLIPFVCAVIWWAWADASGYTKRRAMDKMQDRKDQRRQRNMDALGTGPKSRR